MLGVFVITLLTGLEGFLVVGAAVAFARKMQQPALVRAIRWGIVGALATIAAGAWWLARVPGQVWWERRFAIAAAVAIVVLAAFMWHWRGLLRDAPPTRPARPNGAIRMALFAFTIVVLSREGIHTLMLLLALLGPIRLTALRVSVVAGLAAAVACAWAWGRFAPRLRGRAFMWATAAVLAVTLALVLGDAIRDRGAPPGTGLELVVEQ